VVPRRKPRGASGQRVLNLTRLPATRDSGRGGGDLRGVGGEGEGTCTWRKKKHNMNMRIEFLKLEFAARDLRKARLVKVQTLKEKDGR